MNEYRQDQGMNEITEYSTGKCQGHCMVQNQGNCEKCKNTNYNYNYIRINIILEGSQPPCRALSYHGVICNFDLSFCKNLYYSWRTHKWSFFRRTIIHEVYRCGRRPHSGGAGNFSNFKKKIVFGHTWLESSLPPFPHSPESHTPPPPTPPSLALFWLLLNYRDIFVSGLPSRMVICTSIYEAKEHNANIIVPGLCQ